MVKNKNNNFKMSMDKRVLMVLGLSFVMIISLVIVYFEGDIINSSYCSELAEFKDSNFTASVSRKYVDPKNHNVKTIQFINGKKLLLNRDTSNFFYFLKEEDIIIKNKGSDFIIVQRGEIKTQFRIFFGCN
jgi:hypothetical protein